MIRISKAQAWLLDPPAKRKGGPRLRRPAAELPENQLEAQIKGYLQVKGWTVIRRHVGTFVPYALAVKHLVSNVVHIGERGESDWLCLRATNMPGVTQTFTLETKAPGAKPSADQLLWMDRQRVGGFIAVWFDNLDRFQEWYRETWKP